MNLHHAQRVRGSEEFADILLATELNAKIEEDGKHFVFSSGVIKEEYERRRRERKREESRLHQGMHGDSQTASGYKERVRRSTSFNFTSVHKRPGR